MLYWLLSLSVTASSLLRFCISTDLIWPLLSCDVNVPKPGSFFLFGLEMSCWAKNARMTTIRIGNIALLEKRLIGMHLGRSRRPSVAGVIDRPGRWCRGPAPCRWAPGRLPSAALFEHRDVREV